MHGLPLPPMTVDTPANTVVQFHILKKRSAMSEFNKGVHRSYGVRFEARNGQNSIDYPFENEEQFEKWEKEEKKLKTMNEQIHTVLEGVDEDLHCEYFVERLYIQWFEKVEAFISKWGCEYLPFDTMIRMNAMQDEIGFPKTHFKMDNLSITWFGPRGCPHYVIGYDAVCEGAQGNALVHCSYESSTSSA